LFLGILLTSAPGIGVAGDSAPAIVDADAVATNTVSLDAKDADIRDILLGLARANGINLILDDSVQGRFTICLNNMPPPEAIELILYTNGFVTEKVGDSIVAATPEELVNVLPRISKIIILKHAVAMDLKQSVSGIIPGQADIQADIRTNSLIITGAESSIHALEQAIELLDVALPPEPEVPTVIRTFPLEHAQASSIQMLISEFCSPEGAVQVDDRTNSLIVKDQIAFVERLTEVIQQLDVLSPEDATEGAESEVYTRVFKPNYIDANALKEVLQDMLSTKGRIQTFVRQKKSIIPLVTEGMGVLDEVRKGTSTGTSAEIRESAEQKWSDVLIVTDIASVIENMDSLISKLDTRAAQVMIEARMVEISLTDIQNLGIDWHATHTPSKSNLGVELPASRTDGKSVPMLVQIGTLSKLHFEDIMFKLQALETEGNAKLISNPSVITLDNELAQMVVADRIPIPTIHETEFGITTSYEFRNVGIVLKVTPHITEDGYILMDARPEVNSIRAWTPGDSPQPIISSRVAHSRVRVKNGETLVVGGLIRDEQRETESRVPLLHGIPFLGRIFKSKDFENVKTDLVVFITPRICEDDL